MADPAVPGKPVSGQILFADHRHNPTGSTGLFEPLGSTCALAHVPATGTLVSCPGIPALTRRQHRFRIRLGTPDLPKGRAGQTDFFLHVPTNPLRENRQKPRRMGSWARRRLATRLISVEDRRRSALRNARTRELSRWKHAGARPRPPTLSPSPSLIAGWPVMRRAAAAAV